VRYALQHPDRIKPHLRRAWRDLRFRLGGARDHVEFYRAVMRDDVAADPDKAVGSASRDRWLALGQLQFDYLLEHGLRRDHDVLDIGCGNLRAGWRLARYLEPGRYHGVDISPDVLLAANATVEHYDLQCSEPRLRLVDDLRFGWLPDQRFDVVHAHSVFSHTPITVVAECFANVGRVLRADGWFDLTFNATSGKEHHVLHEDYYYRPETLLALAERHGLEGERMEDWTPRHRQRKLRLRHAGARH
jgi:SAM-dependent methyltransferase